ncbi:MAG TPA: ABC transporter ATP-binding protein [Gammaproteobacteria bacterium]|nr:ABC transporter ATP-binding protein [Gammaproteobacteria bacterium]
MIEIEGLNFRYPGASRDAIRDLSLRVPAGALFGLLGPNGSGKTTLISILTGLLPAASGTVRIDGHSLPGQLHDIHAFSALVPQDYAFYPRLSVMENLRFFAGVLALPAGVRAARVQDALSVAGLADFRNARAAQLSGGLKRRLNLAIGLLNRPRLLFLDEPTVGIDPQSRRFILDAIKHIAAEGTTVVYTSHYMEEVEMLCDEIGVLDDGRLLARGTLQQLLGGGNGQGLAVTLAEVPTPAQHAALSALPGLVLDGVELKVTPTDGAGLNRVLALLAAQGVAVRRMKYGYGNLEELFLHLTGRQLRD